MGLYFTHYTFLYLPRQRPNNVNLLQASASYVCWIAYTGVFIPQMVKHTYTSCLRKLFPLFLRIHPKLSVAMVCLLHVRALVLTLIEALGYFLPVGYWVYPPYRSSPLVHAYFGFGILNTISSYVQFTTNIHTCYLMYFYMHIY